MTSFKRLIRAVQFGLHVPPRAMENTRVSRVGAVSGGTQEHDNPRQNITGGDPIPGNITGGGPPGGYQEASGSIGFASEV